MNFYGWKYVGNFRALKTALNHFGKPMGFFGNESNASNYLAFIYMAKRKYKMSALLELGSVAINNSI